jgi:hypothetical protein
LGKRIPLILINPPLQQYCLNLKVDKAAGKGLSTEDYSTAEKTKLAALTGKGNYSFTSSRKHCC